jgi:hypothetical protein
MRDEARNNAAASGGCSVRMWGYLPAASPQRTPLLQPTSVPITPLNDPLKTVCNGGCGFGIAISGTQLDRTISVQPAANRQKTRFVEFLLRRYMLIKEYTLKD